MKILFVIPYTPSRIRVRPYHFILESLRLGHDVTVATLAGSAADGRAVHDLQAAGARVLHRRLTRLHSVGNCLVAMAGSDPVQSRYSWHPGLARDIEALVAAEDFEIVHVEHLRGAAYGLRLMRGLASADDSPDDQPRPAVVWDSVDCISRLFAETARTNGSLRAQLISRLELPSTRRMERRLARAFALQLVTTEQERDAFAALLGSSTTGSLEQQPPIEVIGNGVDLGYFAPSAAPRAANSIVLSGKMSYHVNDQAARYLLSEIMPLVWRRCPDAVVTIVGQGPGRRLKGLARRCGGRVHITGAVPDVRDHLQTATVAVAPVVYGAGVKNKVLEAMACGTAVVATPVAVDSLEVRHGDELLVAGAAADFAAQVVAVLQDPRLRERLGAQARRRVEQFYSWAVMGERLEALYRHAASRSHR